MKHYDDFEDITDKIVHLLYAGYVCDFYDKAINECIDNFGKNATSHAEQIFDLKYKTACYRSVS